jgi:hypothetical protein
MKRRKYKAVFQTLTISFTLVGSLSANAGETIALWLFDEQTGIYPSCFLTDAGPNGYPLVLGRGGRIVEGKFGNALEPQEPLPLELPAIGGSYKTGILVLDKKEGRTVEPLSWATANFCAFFTPAEEHLRKRELPNPTKTDLNLGDFDWTVEFWFKANGVGDGPGTVFEIGEGPRGENDRITSLRLDPSKEAFIFTNQPSGTEATVTTDPKALASDEWRHYALSYDSNNDMLHHWVNGKKASSADSIRIEALPFGKESYFTIGRDALWNQPLGGALDELRISKGLVYGVEDFEQPGSFSQNYAADRKKPELAEGPPLLFPNEGAPEPVPLGSRKHLFVDDALIEKNDGIEWVVNPPSRRDLASRPMRGHLTVLQDDEGLIRIYGQGPKDSLAVIVSEDGIDFSTPDLGIEYHGVKNVVIRDAVGLGQVFIDPNAPPAERWKYLSGRREQAVYLYTSPDGWSFERNETAALPFWAGSQSNIYYDDQRQVYVAFHRSDYGHTPMGKTERRFVMTEVTDLLRPWPFEPATTAKTEEVARDFRIKNKRTDPWFLDNGPMAPGGFGIEYPIVFGPDDDLDPIPTDVYIPKVVKYPWAPDTYIAFPHFYFHYQVTGVEARDVLGDEESKRGSGVVEIQTMSSRDGLSWKRYPRPVYIGPGQDRDVGEIHMSRMVQGMIRRGNEIWQYQQTDPNYHSDWRNQKREGKPGLFRLIQRLDGFIAAQSPYTGGEMITRPLVFEGNRLTLNIDTEGTGYAQVGFLDKKGEPIPGFGMDACIYINGDFYDTEVEWLDRGKDVSELAGKPVRIVFRMRGSKLYAMQFTQVN